MTPHEKDPLSLAMQVNLGQNQINPVALALRIDQPVQQTRLERRRIAPTPLPCTFTIPTPQSLLRAT
jgi:hypothetical protein